MNREQINELMDYFSQRAASFRPQLIETHISWVVLADEYVYKIKKPIRYSFLDYSTLEKRRSCCERELVLNRRLTEQVYLDVVPVRQGQGGCLIGGEAGEVVDYAVKMRKMDPRRQMDLLLREDKVSYSDMGHLAEKIAGFHRRAEVIPVKDIMDIPLKFADLADERVFLSKDLPIAAYIEWAVDVSMSFMEKHRNLAEGRLRDGFIRDCHGDLHTRNIFLLDEPTPFDCVEFSDDLRQIDVLNEVAFLCMDLEAAGRGDLSAVFLTRYNELFPVIRTQKEEKLFIYFKSYRANVRAKVNSYRARSASTGQEREAALREAEKYLMLMKGYLEQL